MTEGTITLRDLFDVDVNDLSARAEPGVDVYQAAEGIQEEIRKGSRAIRWAWVRELIAKKSAEILDLNVIDVLLDAWKKYMQIEQYADKSKCEPKETILCPLAEHTVTSEHHPYLEILLKERPVGRIVFDLDFSLTLEGFVLKIEDGAIREIQTGSGKGEGSLSLANTVLLKRELRPVRFPGHIHLGAGIPLRASGKSGDALSQGTAT
jgi:hypothetical protein